MLLEGGGNVRRWGLMEEVSSPAGGHAPEGDFGDLDPFLPSLLFSHHEVSSAGRSHSPQHDCSSASSQAPSDRAKQSWTETAEVVSPDKAFPCKAGKPLCGTQLCFCSMARRGRSRGHYSMKDAQDTCSALVFNVSGQQRMREAHHRQTDRRRE